MNETYVVMEYLRIDKEKIKEKCRFRCQSRKDAKLLSKNVLQKIWEAWVATPSTRNRKVGGKINKKELRQQENL